MVENLKLYMNIYTLAAIPEAFLKYVVQELEYVIAYLVIIELDFEKCDIITKPYRYQK